METELKNLPLPTQSDTAELYAGVYLNDYTCSTWNDVCAKLGIDRPETQSGKIALERAIKRAKEQTGTTTSESPADLMRRAIELMQPAQVIDENAIRAIIQAEIKGLYKGIEVRQEGKEGKKIDGVFHTEFDNVLKLSSIGEHLYLFGPAGTGKSHFGSQIAECLNIPFASISVCAQSTKSDFLGFMSANGQYIQTDFRRIYENGGLFLVDEIDNGNPNILAVLNSGLANGGMSFPDGYIKRHKDFRCIATANTYGTGATEQYIGRNPIDAATQNRFLKTFVGYDNKLEAAIYSPTACQKVWEARQRLEGQTGWVLSMRNIQRFDNCINAGFSEKQAYQMAVIDQVSEQFRKLLK
jgi:cobaltochelatase CobS